MLATLQVWLVSRIGWRQRGRRDAAGHENHRTIAPPTLSLKPDRFDRTSQIQQSRVVRYGRPARRLAQVINSRPQKLSGVRFIVAQGDPDRSIVAVLSSQYFARGPLLMRREDFILT